MKTCIVFGVGPGVGLSLIKLYDSKGFNTVAIARDKARLQGLLRAEGLSRTTVFSVDAANVQAVSTVLNEITEQHKEVDTFIYNAAAMDNLGGHGPFNEIDINKFNQDFQASVSSAFLSAQIVLKQMKPRKKGTVLFTGGGLALNPNPSWGTLSMGKSGIRTLAQLLHTEMSPYGISCGTVLIVGMVGSTQSLAPAKIAEAFYAFNDLSGGSFEVHLN